MALIKRKVGAERFGSTGRRAEYVDLTVTMPNYSVIYLEIEGNKKTQHFMMNRVTWDALIPLTIKEMGKRYAVCAGHAADALYELAGTNMNLIRVDGDDEHYKCHCGLYADFYFRELSGKVDN